MSVASFSLRFTRKKEPTELEPSRGVVFHDSMGPELTIVTWDHTAGQSPAHALDLSICEEEVLYQALRSRRKLRREALR